MAFLSGGELNLEQKNEFIAKDVLNILLSSGRKWENEDASFGKQCKFFSVRGTGVGLGLRGHERVVRVFLFFRGKYRFPMFFYGTIFPERPSIAPEIPIGFPIPYPARSVSSEVGRAGPLDVGSRRKIPRHTVRDGQNRKKTVFYRQKTGFFTILCYSSSVSG